MLLLQFEEPAQEVSRQQKCNSINISIKTSITLLVNNYFYKQKTHKIPTTVTEKQAVKKEVDRVNNKTRVNIGVTCERWNEHQDLKGLSQTLR